MKIFFMLAVVLFGVLHIVSGAARYVANARNPAYPGKCYDTVTKSTVNRGATIYKGCEKWSCSNDYGLEVVGCGLAVAQQGCQIKSDSSKRYPDCCPKEVCPK
ncbi:U-scoloptoxin(16)-Er13a-like [Culex pipiens pallens]|uniref:U-scoloptoxin(16)-Er13a-like n=1 Tax=Culex pipiens pallens TaxID=42434 RepID=UPI0019536FF4|nr:U-scoloptoxin(16)-Er13a-like [Culex pipiens pallens]